MPKDNTSLSKRILKGLEPLMALVPEVPGPTNPINIKDKMMWTVIILFLYLVCSQIPLYGIQKMAGDDPLYWTRVILASNRGTLMELGISPIITAGMIMQLLAGAKIIDLEMDQEEDKNLFEKSQKLLALIIGFLEAIVYVWSGLYGEVATIGAVNCALIVAQLTFAAILVTLLDEVLSNGYGMGSAISLFIATNVCEEIVWKSFSPMAYGNEYEGALINFVYLMISKPNKLAAIQGAFYRDHGPNINNLLATVFVFLLVVWLQGFQVDIAVHNTQQRGSVGNHGIKLFYTSNMPIILMSALVSNVFFISKTLYKRFGSFFLVRWLGRWKEASIGGQSYPVSGLAYYISPPQNLSNMISDPLHGIIYIVFILVACAVFSRTWTEIGGSDSKKVYEQLKRQKLTSYGGSDRLLRAKLDKYINLASSLGGVCVGMLTIIADFLGAIGSGTGILLSCNIICELYEVYKQEARTMVR
jgi:protein transport protein SEC61 subunit alpha